MSMIYSLSTSMWRSLISHSLTEYASLSPLKQIQSSIFDLFCHHFDDHFLNLRSTNMKDLKTNKAINREKGLIFEEICAELLRQGSLLAGYHLVNVWRFSELSDEHLLLLGFVKSNGKVNRQDVGIDIVARDGDGRWYAIQCKYRQKPLKPSYNAAGYPRRWKVPWEELSTFYALCARTGEGSWYKMVVMTNCEGIARKGRQLVDENEKKKDVTIAHGTFAGIEREHWEKLCGYQGHRLDSPISSNSNTHTIEEKEEKSNSIDEVRRKRLEWLSRLEKNQ